MKESKGKSNQENVLTIYRKILNREGGERIGLLILIVVYGIFYLFQKIMLETTGLILPNSIEVFFLVVIGAYGFIYSFIANVQLSTKIKFHRETTERYEEDARTGPVIYAITCFVLFLMSAIAYIIKSNPSNCSIILLAILALCYLGLGVLTKSTAVSYISRIDRKIRVEYSELKKEKLDIEKMHEILKCVYTLLSFKSKRKIPSGVIASNKKLINNYEFYDSATKEHIQTKFLRYTDNLVLNFDVLAPRDLVLSTDNVYDYEKLIAGDKTLEEKIVYHSTDIAIAVMKWIVILLIIFYIVVPTLEYFGIPLLDMIRNYGMPGP
ncbi:MAG: hypothetical protein WC350_04900 [Candidatus Micrarchaeia archaeon]